MKVSILFLSFALLFMTYVSVRQDLVIDQQRHTIQQCMGLEDGPDATPRPKDELPLSSAPNPPVRSI